MHKEQVGYFQAGARHSNVLFAGLLYAISP